MSDVIDISFGFDSGYAPHAASVIASVVRRAPGQKFRFLILHAGVGRDLQEKLEACAPGSSFVWMEVRDEDMPEYDQQNYITKATLFRFGLEKLAPADAKKILYLDADIAVVADVRKLARTNLDGHPIGAVIDCFIDEDQFAADWGLTPGHAYFNAGVLLLDLEKIRAEKLFTRALDVLAANAGKLPYNDQDALNIVFWNRWRPLGAEWNVQRWMVTDEAPHDLPAHKSLDGRMPAIVHYTGHHKPWLSDAWHPWSWLYWDALRATPFLDEVARQQGVTFMQRMRLRLRYMRRRPPFRPMKRVSEAA